MAARAIRRRRSATALLLAGALAACSRGESASDTTRAATDPVAGPPHAGAPTDSRAPGGTGLVVVPAEQMRRLGVVPVARTTFRPVLQTTGTVAFDADVSTQVLAPISGPVTRILAQPGAVVRRGQALAMVSSPDFAAAVAGYRKALGAATQARRVADLNEKLFKSDALARRDLEQSQIDAAAAAADLDAALQQLRALGVEQSTIDALRENRPVALVEGAIRAPIAGTVVEKLINPGQLLQAGATPTFTIADLSTMWVQANVFESDLPFVRVGDRADVVTAASPKPLVGRVGYIAALVDPATKATAVRVVVTNTGQMLKKDMYVQVGIHASRERQGILVPIAAILRDENNLPFVFVEVPAAGGGPARFARRQVTVGSRVDDRYEVTSGLQAGERIIAEGGLFVQFAESQ
jgi:cobalt-zinc-cadmium efflux system membrane fusion protein